MSRALSKREQQRQQAMQQQQQQYRRDVETKEYQGSANASAGLNLNIFGAFSGALSSKSKKTTHTNPDGSSTSVEDRDDKAIAQGHAAGQGAAYASANATEHGKQQTAREIGQAQGQAKMVQGQKHVDHLGIEG
ncbi:hypothetical protein CC78DRAFT_620088 [Lojkania enalia]|uniref:Uncharacterized protein n=1 Tax=Lojkania enalia TaxID=147567 RepID=A0A9P4K3C8_9PLEO|nr:hypothetical protein CC78DRAFT_620088 [Didymosphaeria enalia]